VLVAQEVVAQAQLAQMRLLETQIAVVVAAAAQEQVLRLLVVMVARALLFLDTPTHSQSQLALV
jgi:hypothetical protein